MPRYLNRHLTFRVKLTQKDGWNEETLPKISRWSRDMEVMDE